MSELPVQIVGTIQKLGELAKDLRRGQHFNITRLTSVKRLCQNADDAAHFALHLSKKTQQHMKRPGRSPLKTQQRYQRLIATAIRRMTSYLRRPNKAAAESLAELLREFRDAQNQYERQEWVTVRIIKSRELLVLETALECVLHPWASADLGYRIARQHTERYNSRYGTGLIPASAPFVQEIAEFWAKRLLGRNWRKVLTR